MGHIVPLVIDFPAQTGTNVASLHIPFPLKGLWRILDAWWAPDTTAAAGDGTNNANVTLATNDGDGGSFTVHSTLSGNGTAFTVGTAREFTGVEGKEVAEGDLIRVAKTVNGTGGTIHGHLCLAVEKVGNT